MADMGLKPTAALSGSELQRINEAIVSGFSPNELKNALRFKWGMVLENYLNPKQGLYDVVAELIDWTERRGKTRELVALAYAERPDNLSVQQVAQELGIALDVVTQKYDLAKPLASKPPLEAMIVKQSRFVDFNTFLSRFKSLGDRVCRIETPAKFGTGFLVGPNLVLTNFHVIDSLNTAYQATQTICRFDYRQDNGGAKSNTDEQNGPITCRLAPEWLVAKSLYSNSDVTGVGEPEAKELDYALIRLAENMGNARTATGDERGWFDLKAERPVLAVRDYVVIPQHAEGHPLKVAWGAVLSFNSLGTRVKYDTTTDSGSSGSPCLTIDLDVFGLHHATDPKKKPEFNQAIPLDIIARDLQLNNFI
jgi:hypothetical protein